MKPPKYLLIVGLAALLSSPTALPAAEGSAALPQVSVDLAPDSVVGSPLVLTGEASAFMGIERVRISIRHEGSNRWLQPDGSFRGEEVRFDAALTPTGPGAVDWNWAVELPDGSYKANIRVVDLAGGRNAVQPWLPFSVDSADNADTVPPTVSTNLKRNDVFRERVAFGGTAADDVAVSRVRVGIRDRVTKKWLHADGNFKTSFYRLWADVQTLGESQVVWSLSADLPPGKYSANIRAVDLAMNRTTILPWMRFDVRPLAGQSAMLVAAGDVVACDHEGDGQTAELLDELFADRDGVLALLGDGVYPDGTPSQYADCYDETWGRHKSRTSPAVGNHDYHTPGAVGYYGYFGAAAGDPNGGFYAYDLGDWRIVVLNSECDQIGGCDAGSPQYEWLQAELAAHPSQCLMSYSHRPRYTSGPHGDTRELKPLWELLYDAGADVALAGHSHNYQRFRKLDAAGNIDALGARSFIIGTGGSVLKPIVERHERVLTVHEGEYGVLVMELRSSGYGWEYVTVGGNVRDSGNGSCG